MRLGQGCHKRTPRWCWAIMLLLAIVVMPGAAFITADADDDAEPSSAPAERFEAHFLPKDESQPAFLPVDKAGGQSKNDLIDIDISRLRQQPPREYLVDESDVLGIYIEGVLGTSEQPPPVNIPNEGSDLPPSIGFPIPVRNDGTLSLPLIPPLKVKGLTVAQIEALIRRAYTIDNKMLKRGKDRIIVTIMKKRTYGVVVMRQELVTRGVTLDLPAYKNDVMHALAQTGGLPAQHEKNEIQILRSSHVDADKRNTLIRKWLSGQLPDSPTLADDAAIVRIPLRLPPGQMPQFTPEDIILEDGDVVLIEGREREVFYTGGLFPAGEYQLPRDYDLDVLNALALIICNQRIPHNREPDGTPGPVGAAKGGNEPTRPSLLFILRRTPCSGQITIAVDLNRAMRDPAARPRVQPGDVLILQHKPVRKTGAVLSP